MSTPSKVEEEEGEDGEAVLFEKCRILYSTQSGRAKACARRTSRILRQETNVTMMMMDNNQKKKATGVGGATFDEEIGMRTTLQEFVNDLRGSSSSSSSSSNTGNTCSTLLLLFVSTTGDGEHTDTIQATWQQLRKKSLPPTLFQGISFAIFNLGDRAYGPQYCAAGRKLAVRLLQLGAKMACEPGYGDDGTPGGGVFADLDVWINDELLKKTFARITLQVDSSSSSSSSSISISPSSDPPSPLIDLPYKVTLGDSSKIIETHRKEGSAKEEWQEDRFAASYRVFFERLAPFNAYAYQKSEDGVWSRNTRGQGNTNNNNSSNTTNTVPSLLLARVVENRRLTAPDWEQDTRHVRLTFTPPDNNDSTASSSSLWSPKSALAYQAGDVAIVIPSNTTNIVERFLSVLPEDVRNRADVPLVIENRNATSPSSSTLGIYGYDGWPKHCTLRGWLTHCADIHNLPDREDLWALSHFCSRQHAMGEEQRNKLQSLSGSSGSSLYSDYILRERRTWADVLYDFDSLRAPGSFLTLEALLSLLSPIRPREFSIASSPTREYQNIVKQQEQHQHESSSHDASGGFGLDLCVAVVRGTTARGRKYHGLCSNYISQLRASRSVVRMWIRPGSFGRLPLGLSSVGDDDGSSTQRFAQPVLYIGAGTGIAPLRGLLHERQAQLQSNGGATLTPLVNGLTAGEGWNTDDILLFGCRQEKSDYYYQSEWQSLQDSGRLEVLTAFSQDQWHKIYVQQVLRKDDPSGKKLSVHITEKAGCIYIAGGPKMAHAVREEIVELLAQQLGGDETQAQQLLNRLQRAGRFCVEAWS